MLQQQRSTGQGRANGRTHSSCSQKHCLAVLQRAFDALDSANSLDDIMRIRDQAQAFRTHAKDTNAGSELRNKAAELKLRAERRAGSLLRSMSLRGGDQKSLKRHFRLTLRGFGITQNQSTRWQKMATVPEEDFCRLVAAAQEGRLRITSAAVLRLATERSGKRYVTTARDG